MTKRRHKSAKSARSLLSRAIPPVGESHALSYALVMALAATPRERFSRRSSYNRGCGRTWNGVRLHLNDEVADR